MIKIFIQTTFEAYHRWLNAPDEVVFLRSFHRHLFHVKVTFSVSHDNRDLEYFMVKRRLDRHIKDRYEGVRMESSCEAIALQILLALRAYEVEVSEDGENGSVVTRSDWKQVAMGVKETMFAGMEVETPLPPVFTLFVPYTTSPEDFIEVSKDWGRYLSRTPQCIYYGAGNRPVLVGGQSIVMMDLIRKTEIPFIVEFLAFNEDVLPKRVEGASSLIFRGEAFAFSPSNVFIKTIDNREQAVVLTDCYGKSHSTWLGHPQYSIDSDIII